MGRMGQGEPEEDGSDRRAAEGTVADRTVAAADVDAVELGVKRWADGLDDVRKAMFTVVNIATWAERGRALPLFGCSPGSAVISVPAARCAERTCGNLIRCQTLSRRPRPKS